MILQRLYLPISRADVERLRTAGELRAGRTAKVQKKHKKLTIW